MRPLDPRLLRYAQSTRGFLAFTVVLGVLTAVLVIVQARLLSGVIVDVTANGATWETVSASVLAIAGVFLGRALLGYSAEVMAFRSAARAKEQLRQAALAHVLALGPAGPAGQDPGTVATLITRGIDALDGYFARYLPQLILAVIIPIAILATVLGQDLLSAIIIAVTLPLIPVFMILIGLYTKARVDRQWKTLAVLSGHFLDLVAGLPTLKIFGRAKSQVTAIRQIGDRYRSSTMGVLKVTFLSSFALEVLASLSVALVAVSVGLRLAEQQIAYGVALFVLLLAPEAYLPLRLVGQHFHAAAEGLGAADRLFTILEQPVPSFGDQPVAAPVMISVHELSVQYIDRPALSATTFTARAGTVTALIGDSGGGKSTVLAALLGFVQPNSGVISWQGSAGVTPLAKSNITAWREHIAWLPQRPHLAVPHTPTPTIGQAVRLARPDASDAQVWAALERAGVADEVADLPSGLHTVLAADGSGVSVGQAQRIALARTLLREAAIVLLDEPTAALDGNAELAVVHAVRSEAERGATVIVVAHRPALIDIADQVVRVGGGVPGQVASAAENVAALSIRRSGW